MRYRMSLAFFCQNRQHWFCIRRICFSLTGWISIRSQSIIDHCTDKNRVFKNKNNVDEIARNQKIMFSTRQPKTFTSIVKRMLSILEHNACDDWVTSFIICHPSVGKFKTNCFQFPVLNSFVDLPLWTSFWNLKKWFLFFHKYGN